MLEMEKAILLSMIPLNGRGRSKETGAGDLNWSNTAIAAFSVQCGANIRRHILGPNKPSQ